MSLFDWNRDATSNLPNKLHDLKRFTVLFFWILPLIFYVLTISTTVGYVDAALVMTNAYNLKISAWVNNHNLFSLLGWVWLKIIPFGTEFFRVNLLSSLFGVLTVYGIFLTCYTYTKHLIVSGIAAISVMMSHSLWWHSTMLEVYSLNTFLISLILLFTLKYYMTLRKRWLYASLAIWGLGVSNHVLMGLFIVAYIVIIIMERKRISLADIGIGTLCFIAGSTLFIFAVVKSYIDYRSFAAVIDGVTGGKFRSLMFGGESRLFWAMNYVFLLIYQYPSSAIFFLFMGVFLLFTRIQRFDYFLIASLTPQIIWSASYHVWDMYAFSLPVYVMLAVLICKGLYRFHNKKLILILAMLFCITPFLLYSNIHKFSFLRRWTQQYPSVEMVRDNFDYIRYFLNPNKRGFDELDRYVTDLFVILPENAHYFDNTHDYPIYYYYQNIRQERQDIQCPVIFAFFVTENEKIRVAARINVAMNRSESVYITKYIYGLVRSKLNKHRVDVVPVGSLHIYSLNPP